MKNIFYIIAFSIFFITSCIPDPLVIDVAQIPAQMTVSSTLKDSNTVIVAMTYSLSSFSNLTEPGADSLAPGVPAGILVDSALITISDGNHTYTLDKTLPGIYSKTGIRFESGKEYSLFVKDLDNGKTIVSKTTYQPALIPDLVLPIVKHQVNGATVQLQMTITDDRPGMDYYFVSYDKINPLSAPSNSAIANRDAIKKIEVFSDLNAVNSVISKTFNIDNINADDTLFVHYGRIDKGYFDYLSAYKRNGGLITYIAAEPLTLPTNIVTGLGYFALYDARKTFFDLKNY